MTVQLPIDFLNWKSIKHGLNASQKKNAEADQRRKTRYLYIILQNIWKIVNFELLSKGKIPITERYASQMRSVDSKPSTFCFLRHHYAFQLYVAGPWVSVARQASTEQCKLQVLCHLPFPYVSACLAQWFLSEMKNSRKVVQI